MGTWGSGLYSNDTTCDVRDIYMGFLRDQLSNQEAYDRTLEKCSEYIEDLDEAPLFWFALAETQWKVGRLIPEVKAKALELIDKGGGLELWEESESGGSGWKKTLEKLRDKLESEQPKEKKIRKPVKIDQNLWNIGDVYAYKFHTDEAKKYGLFERYLAIQKIAEDLTGEELVMRVHLFDKAFDKIPTLEDLKGVRLLPLDYPHSLRADIGLYMSKQPKLIKKKEYPEEYLFYIGNMEPPANLAKPNIYISDEDWYFIESWGQYFQVWQGIEYETVAEGVFRYVKG